MELSREDRQCARCGAAFERAGDSIIFWADKICKDCFKFLKPQTRFFIVTPITEKRNYSQYLNPINKRFPIGRYE